MSLPPLPERRWVAFCSKCLHSEQIPKPTEKAVVCSRCGYCCFAEEQDYTADQLRAAQREIAEECARLIEGYPHWLGDNAKREIAAAIRAKFCAKGE